MLHTLEQLYLDYTNNYLSIIKWAEDNDIPLELMGTILVLGKSKNWGMEGL